MENEVIVQSPSNENIIDKEGISNEGPHFEKLNEVDLLAEMQTSVRQAVVELQMKRETEAKYRQNEIEMERQRHVISNLKSEKEELMQSLESITYTLNRMVHEKETEAKNAAEYLTKSQILEEENKNFRDRLRELVFQNEELTRLEASARAHLNVHESSRTLVQKQLDRFNNIMDSLQENHQRAENEMKRLEEEVYVAKGQKEASNMVENQLKSELETTKDSLRKAYEEIALLTSAIGAERAKNANTTQKESDIIQELMAKEWKLEQSLSEQKKINNEILGALEKIVNAQDQN